MLAWTLGRSRERGALTAIAVSALFLTHCGFVFADVIAPLGCYSAGRRAVDHAGKEFRQHAL